ncbi:extracellular calcium-sensing receptor-like [Polypterus senegalus]|uniref:extracellular calcium-sensing receptor-like n=1 Tax=Polypterus senegalus TaxID=55291 RepID=UPI001965C7AF|nr:extracellular calcium-sensing receptor-like [Polypterus senegalus]
MTFKLSASMLVTLLVLVPVCENSACRPQGHFQFNELYKPGDVILGGIFAVHFKAIAPELSFRTKPEQWKCESFDINVFQRAQVMAFAIEEINNDPALLPNVSLGYRLYDDCMNLQVSLRAALALIGGLGDVRADSDCKGRPPVVAIVGEPLSTHSIAVSRTVGVFSMPMISFCASCSCLSNKLEFPSFLRTAPSDAFQIKVMAEIIKHYRWTWVGTVGTDDDYGRYELRSLNQELESFGCIAFSEALNVNEKGKLLNVVKIIKQSSAKIIVVFLTKMDADVFITEIVRQNITGRQWIASDSWSPFPIFASNENFKSFGGTIGIIPRRGVIPGLETFLLQLRPDADPSHILYKQFWEAMFECKFSSNLSVLANSRMCTGSEDLGSTKTEYSDVSQLRGSYNVYTAVYAVAHALHSLMSCENGKGPFQNDSCADVATMQPWQLLHYLKKVNFITNTGDRVAFDENGDPVAVFDVINWQKNAEGKVISKTIGVFDESAALGHQLSLKEEDIFWNFEFGTIPESVCSKSCLPGTRKATRKGEPICCFDCVTCAEGEFTDEIDSVECQACPPDFWSSPKRNKCDPKDVEFLSYEDGMGITLTATALSGVWLSVGVLAVFIYYRRTPVVKANNSELSFLLLVSLILCFLCSLCFIGKPSPLTCMLRHVVFGISFVLCISCILVKTIVVLMAFKAALPGNNMMKWFGATQQRGTVFALSFVQFLICIVWLVSAPPVPAKNTRYNNAKIIFECDIGSVTGFSCLLGYIGLLACVSFLLAFLARRLPDTFNEAKFITFSMLIFCAVWITFIPAYVSSPGKHTVAVEIFAILASSFGVLVAIFGPKCYIILLRPELNTKKALMGRDIVKNQ